MRAERVAVSMAYVHAVRTTESREISLLSEKPVNSVGYYATIKRARRKISGPRQFNHYRIKPVLRLVIEIECQIYLTV